MTFRPERYAEEYKKKWPTQKIDKDRAPLLVYENERTLATHLKKLQKRGFAATKEYVKVLTFNFACSLNIQHKIAIGKTGYDSLNAFLRQNSGLNVRKSKELSMARIWELNKHDC